MRKFVSALIVAGIIALPLAGTVVFAAPSCEGECDAYYSAAVDADMQGMAQCNADFGYFFCSGWVIQLGAHVAGWGVCKAGCAGPYIMSAVRFDEVVNNA